jgi:hypothetical protein
VTAKWEHVSQFTAKIVLLSVDTQDKAANSTLMRIVLSSGTSPSTILLKKGEKINMSLTKS